jgi:hypothetical protein
VAIAASSADWFWFFRKHYEVNFKSSVTFPFLNAIIGPLASGSVADIGKAFVLLSVIAATVSLAVFAWHRHDWLVLSTVLPLLLFAATVNAHEGFVIVRYAPLLVIPFCSWAAANADWSAVLTSRWCAWATAVILVVSQWAWAAYTVKYFWSER